ncbi:MAG: hypothetical protein INH41_17630 [Myxococcaceae bacterium]|nr:hypothetical protein [Myxococcaceae bacterium]MCA3014206.1 hypothetical protein [Myxococcaceae bacterium]
MWALLRPATGDAAKALVVTEQTRAEALIEQAAARPGQRIGPSPAQ